ncbi:MAG TPA: hypothetical protein VIP48_00660 [Streptosporangiaceae bacterium]
MPSASAYDEIADWYEHEFLGQTEAAGDDPIGIERALHDLLGQGSGICLEIGCRTGIRWTKASWTDQGVRDKVGASHLPLPSLLHAFLDAGLLLERFTEGGTPTPTVVAVKARKPG